VAVLLVVTGVTLYASVLKCEQVGSPSDPSAHAILYYRGLGFTNSNSWWGKRKVKLIDKGYYSSNTNGGYVSDPSAEIVIEVTYYPNGTIESERPKSQKGGMDADGIHKCYHENGTLAEEIGVRVNPSPECICCTFETHGIDKEYDERGRLTLEKWFIYGKECDKSEWAAWLEKHPNDVLYGSIDR
jgi:hypothetical protein